MTIDQRRDDLPNQWRIQVRGSPARVADIRWREATRDAVIRSVCDLDNFAKPVLDTLFTSQNVSPRVTGVLLPVNDTWVFRLLLEKVQVKTPQEQGADLTVTWHPAGTPGLSTS